MNTNENFQTLKATVYLTPENKKALRVLAAEKGWTQTGIINIALTEFLEAVKTHDEKLKTEENAQDEEIARIQAFCASVA